MEGRRGGREGRMREGGGGNGSACRGTPVAVDLHESFVAIWERFAI